MGKIRPYPLDDPELVGYVIVNHFYTIDPYEPGAYHTVYAYLPEDLPPSTDAWQTSINLAHAAVAARDWASRPAMINDVCLACRYQAYGANLPRWNIYRGQEHPKYDPILAEYPAHFVACYFMPWWDPPPPAP